MWSKGSGVCIGSWGPWGRLWERLSQGEECLEEGPGERSLEEGQVNEA